MDKWYPNSKFILTLRKDNEALVLSDINQWKKIGKVNIPPKERFIERYEKHNQTVLEYFKNRPDDLLTMCIEKEDGWEKLCKFLGKDIPNEPFPHSNRGDYKPIQRKFECLEGHTFIDCFDKKSVIIDLGANKGQFSKLMMEKYPQSTIILIEGNPHLIQDLKSTFGNKENIKIINVVIGPITQDSVKFYLSNNSKTSSIYKSIRDEFEVEKEINEVNLKMITLNDLFSLFNLEKIDLLKMDIEGAEWDILESFSKEDYKRVDQISVEFHDFVDPSLRKRSEQCIEKLKKFGYSLVYEGTDYLHGSPYINCLFYKNE